ncbi:multicopper oxidase family protein, partial [Burkholderia multivorans]
MTDHRPFNSRPLRRRGFLTGALGVLALTGCAAQASGPDFLDPEAPRIDDVEADRESTGATVTVDLTAAASTLTLGTTTAETWSFGEIPAPVIRMNAGDRLQATLR